MSSFNPYNNGTNPPMNMRSGGSFDDYDSIDGEFSIQMAQTDDESMVMSELGSVLGGVSVVGNQRTVNPNYNRDSNNGTNHVPPAYGYDVAAAAEIQQIKSSEEEIYEDDTNTSYDASMPEDCASFMNSELGISAGDVSAILFGGRSANYQTSSATSEGYVNGLFGSNRVSSGYDSNLNTSQDDTIGDLFARDDTSVMDSIIGPALDKHLQIGKPKKLGPLGDELSYAQDDSTAPPIVPAYEKTEPVRPDLHLDMSAIMNDEGMLEEEEQRGILPVWLSTSNSRTKSLLVVSAALIVGSLVMAIVALGANSKWFGAEEPNGAGPASFSEVDGDFREINPFEEPTMVPSLKPSKKPSKKPTRRPTMAPVQTLSEETGESFVDVAATEATTTTTEATKQTTITTAVVTTTAKTTTSEITTQIASTEGTTAMATNAPTVSISPSTLAPIESPTMSPSYVSSESPSLPPSRKPITSTPTLTPTVNPSELPTIQPTTESPSISPSDAPTTKSPTKVPSSSPSNSPTLHPTTETPTISPSLNPSTVPTTSPTTQPSKSPTTRKPSAHPTNSPSNTPTSSPSDGPSTKPTAEPTSSMAPTLSIGAEATSYGDATFYLMAEGGTNVPFWKEKLESLEADKNGAKFLVHLGSAVRKVDNCIESAYVKTKLSLKSTPVPAYAVPGNHDWPTCTNSTRGLNLWKKHFSSIDSLKWSKPVEYSVKHQTPTRPENFAFLWKRIMFIGLHVVNSGDAVETASRNQDNIDWVNENVERYLEDIDVIFMMGNGRFMATENIPFYNEIVTKKQNEWKHKYVIYARRAAETGILSDIGGLSKFDELRVGAEWPILDVQISNSEGEGRGPGSNAKLRYREVRDVVIEDEKKEEKKSKDEPE